MRVQVQIPGSMESYCVDERGNKLEATEEHWLETYLCSVLRAYSYADNGSGDVIKRIIGVRRFNPITTTEQEQKFMDAAEKLFFSGGFDLQLRRSTLTIYIRLAPGFRSRNSSAQPGLEPSYFWPFTLLQGLRTLCIRDKSL